MELMPVMSKTPRTISLGLLTCIWPPQTIMAFCAVIKTRKPADEM